MQDASQVLVVGGGIAGLTAAHELAQAGCGVTVIEGREFAGGLCADFCCKATDKCAQCGLCIFTRTLDELRNNVGVRLLVGTTIDGVKRQNGGFSVKLAHTTPRIQPEKCTLCGECEKVCPARPIAVRQTPPHVVPSTYIVEEPLCMRAKGRICILCSEVCPVQAIQSQVVRRQVVQECQAILLTVGAEPFDARRKSQFGYGSLPGVLTGHDLEKLLQAGGEVKFPGRSSPPTRLAFIQCVGSRDESLRQNYCSTVCCRYSMRMALLLKSRLPSLAMTIFYMDLQTSGKGFAEFYEAHKNKFEFIRTIPGRLRTTPDGGVLAHYDDTASKKVLKVPFDVVVLAVGLAPTALMGQLSRVLGVNRTEAGFFEGQGPQRVLTNMNRIFVAGTCESPKDISSTVAQAKAAAAAVVRHLT
jgi:heterodisulfide reductase subunit A-like polyferredoxin